MTDVVYRLEKVSKAYGSREVLRVGSLEIQQGEIFGVVGPSGAGKSTLLRLLDFLEPPTSGQLRFTNCYSSNGSFSAPSYSTPQSMGMWLTASRSEGTKRCNARSKGLWSRWGCRI